MEAASPLTAGHLRILGAPVAPNKIKTWTLTARPYSATPRLESRLRIDGGGWAARCVAGSGGLVAEVERELAEEAGVEMGRWVEKCCGGGGVEGVVELLECLEKEAIMGEDEGKEPGDYNRRARIFDRSSRVFQALRETEEAEAAATTTTTATAAPPCSEITPT